MGMGMVMVMRMMVKEFRNAAGRMDVGRGLGMDGAYHTSSLTGHVWQVANG